MRAFLRYAAVGSLVLAGLAPLPAHATFGSATAAIIAQTTQQATQFVKSMLGQQQTNENIVAGATNTTNAIKSSTKANALLAQQSATAKVAAMRQQQQANGIIDLYKAQSGLTPPASSCMQTDAAEEDTVGAAQAGAASASAATSLSLNNAGVPLDTAAAQSAHVSRITTAAAAAAYQSAVAAQTQGRAFQAGALFHPAPPASSAGSSTSPANGSGSPALTPTQTATLFAAEVTAPTPIGAPTSDLSNGHGAAVWRATALAANARLSLAQAALRQTLRWRVPSPALATWAQAIGRMSTPSGLFLKQKLAQDYATGVSSDTMLKWLAAGRFQNPLWYQSMSGATQTALVRSLVFMEAQSLAMQDRELRLLERMEAMDSTRMAMQTRHRERRVIATLGASP